MQERVSFVNTQRRSPMFHTKTNHDTPNPKSAKRSVSKPQIYVVGSRRSPRLNNPSLRRSPILNNDPSDTKLSITRLKGGEAETKENRVVSVERKRKRVEVKTQENGVVLDEGFGGSVKKRGNGEKTKRGGQEISKGWTKEQELALQRAYFSATPSPHFWKNVSKLVPGKSPQDCFDRIQCDHMTPPQTQCRRSRAKTLNSSPLHEFDISASKLLMATGKAVRKSNVLKPKNIIIQKSVENLLQRHLNFDLDREAGIFSVLEPNIDLSTNALQPSIVLSTPKQVKENKEFLQSCTETSSSSHKKSLSRFSGVQGAGLVSPPVLKKVKNRVMHEKYINQLRCRESKRLAASKKIIGEGSRIQKRDAVKAAKIAMVS